MRHSTLDNQTTKNNRYIIIAVVLVIVVIALVLLFNKGASRTQVKQLQRQNFAQARQLEHLTARLTVLTTEAELNQQALVQTREIIKLLELQIYQQQQDINAYKIALNKQTPIPKVMLRDIVIEATEQVATYRYKLILVNTSNDQTNLAGDIQLSIVGIDRKQNKPVTLPWSVISTDPNYQNKITFKLSTLLMIPAGSEFAELTLPEDFIPKTVNAKIQLTLKNSPAIEQQFNWHKQLTQTQ